MEKDLIEHQTATAIVQNVALAIAETREAYTKFRAAKTRLYQTLGHSNYYDTVVKSGSYYSDYSFNEKAEEESVKLITQNAWRYILEQTGLNHFMTEKRKKELQEQIKSNQLPELTVDNIFMTLEGLGQRVDDLLKESIKEVFNWLRPRHDWGTGALKTNKKFSVGKKAIVGWAIQRNYSGGFSVNYHRDAEFIALGNVFTLLDGKGVKKYPDDFRSKFNEKMKVSHAGDVYEDEYFRMKCYGNGNLHIEFKRLDLLQELNRIGAEGHEELPGHEHERKASNG